AERSKRSTTAAAAAAKPAAATTTEPAGAEGSAAGTKPAVAEQIGERQRPKRTTAKGPVPGEKRTAKETAATAWRESVTIARLRKAAGKSVFPIAITGPATG